MGAEVMLFTLPNLLTLSRIFVIPALVGAFYLPGELSSWVPLGLFIAAGVTDFLDGFLARSRDELSSFGRFLDPVADKLLVAATILMLVAIDRISGWSILPAVVILCREIMVSGLREFLAEIKIGMPVSRLAKWKTTAQILALCFLMVGDAAWPNLHIALIGDTLLWIAGALTVWTGFDYFRAGMEHFATTDDGGRPPMTGGKLDGSSSGAPTEQAE
jgi:cardiolipin synthase